MPADLAPFDTHAVPPKLKTIRDAMQPYAIEGDTGMAYGQECKYVTWNFDPEQYDHIEISQITDVQFGHVACRVDRIKEFRDWILAEPYRFMLWTGDMVDAWAFWSPGTPWEQQCDPQR